jgi:hypothetical protein
VVSVHGHCSELIDRPMCIPSEKYATELKAPAMRVVVAAGVLPQKLGHRQRCFGAVGFGSVSDWPSARAITKFVSF